MRPRGSCASSGIIGDDLLFSAVGLEGIHSSDEGNQAIKHFDSGHTYIFLFSNLKRASVDGINFHRAPFFVIYLHARAVGDHLAGIVDHFADKILADVATEVQNSLEFAGQTNQLSDTLDAAPAVDAGSGLVRIPITGHTFAVGDFIEIRGTDNYDGWYIVQAVVANVSIDIKATFVAETFAATDTIEGKLVVFMKNVRMGNKEILQSQRFSNSLIGRRIICTIWFEVS